MIVMYGVINVDDSVVFDRNCLLDKRKTSKGQALLLARQIIAEQGIKSFMGSGERSLMIYGVMDVENNVVLEKNVLLLGR